MSDSDERVGRPTPPGMSQLSVVLHDALMRLVSDGRERLLRAADDGRSMLRIRALQKDRDALLVRLGKTAYYLQESGEIDHPAVAKAMTRIDLLDGEIQKLREEIARAGGDPPTG